MFKQKLNYLKELQWVLFNKQKIRPLNENLKCSISGKPKSNNMTFKNKIRHSSFSSLDDMNEEVCKRHKLFYMYSSPTPTPTPLELCETITQATHFD